MGNYGYFDSGREEDGLILTNSEEKLIAQNLHHQTGHTLPFLINIWGHLLIFGKFATQEVLILATFAPDMRTKHF